MCVCVFGIACIVCLCVNGGGGDVCVHARVFVRMSMYVCMSVYVPKSVCEPSIHTGKSLKVKRLTECDADGQSEAVCRPQRVCACCGVCVLHRAAAAAGAVTGMGHVAK